MPHGSAPVHSEKGYWILGVFIGLSSIEKFITLLRGCKNIVTLFDSVNIKYHGIEILKSSVRNLLRKVLSAQHKYYIYLRFVYQMTLSLCNGF